MYFFSKLAERGFRNRTKGLLAIAMTAYGGFARGAAIEEAVLVALGEEGVFTVVAIHGFYGGRRLPLCCC